MRPWDYLGQEPGERRPLGPSVGSPHHWSMLPLQLEKGERTLCQPGAKYVNLWPLGSSRLTCRPQNPTSGCGPPSGLDVPSNLRADPSGVGPRRPPVPDEDLGRSNHIDREKWKVTSGDLSVTLPVESPFPFWQQLSRGSWGWS